jgi:hypothetical protein
MAFWSKIRGLWNYAIGDVATASAVFAFLLGTLGPKKFKEYIGFQYGEPVPREWIFRLLCRWRYVCQIAIRIMIRSRNLASLLTRFGGGELIAQVFICVESVFKGDDLTICCL